MYCSQCQIFCWISKNLVCNELSGFVAQNDLQNPSQSDFKMTRSTETALMAAPEKIHAVRLGKLSSTMTLLDLSAAVRTVNRKNLLSAHMSQGLNGKARWSVAFYWRSYQMILRIDIPLEYLVFFSFSSMLSLSVKVYPDMVFHTTARLMTPNLSSPFLPQTLVFKLASQ